MERIFTSALGGVIQGGIMAIGALVFVYFNRKRKEQNKKQMDASEERLFLDSTPGDAANALNRLHAQSADELRGKQSDKRS